MFPKSIRWRMQIWLAFLLAGILSGFGVTAYQLHRTNQIRQIDEELERRVAALSGDVRGRLLFGLPPGWPSFDPRKMWKPENNPSGQPPEKPSVEPGHESPPPRRPGPDSKGRWGGPTDFRDPREYRLSSQTLNLFDETETNDFYYTIWSRSGTLRKRSTNAPSETPRPERVGMDTSIRTRTRDVHREAFHFTEMGECVLAGRSITADLDAIGRFAWLLVVAGGAVLAFGLGGGWLLASRALRPVEAISAAASRISAGNLAERINVADTDSELGRLAGVLNSTFARLSATFAQQKQFTADASHELRTPITVLISEAQTTLARERSAAEYRETLEGCLDTAQQMKRLTQSLLALARYDAGQEPIERHPVNLSEQARACVELIRPLARERDIQIHCELAPVEVLGDADRLSQILTNLLSNAIHYNKDHGEIRVATRAETDTAVLTVTDTGPGITADDLPHVFERFYRADKSRARDHGHWGLGLAISKAIVDAHGGSLEVSSQPGQGATFTVRLPRN